MANVGRWLYPKAGAASHHQQQPFVFDDGSTKSRSFPLDQLQSRMNKKQPDALEVDYTKTMMAFLLLAPAPRQLAMIGLGGGSLVRFCHRHLPRSRMTVAEINPCGDCAARRVPDSPGQRSAQDNTAGGMGPISWPPAPARSMCCWLMASTTTVRPRSCAPRPSTTTAAGR